MLRATHTAGGDLTREVRIWAVHVYRLPRMRVIISTALWAGLCSRVDNGTAQGKPPGTADLSVRVNQVVWTSVDTSQADMSAGLFLGLSAFVRLSTKPCRC